MMPFFSLPLLGLYILLAGVHALITHGSFVMTPSYQELNNTQPFLESF